MPGLSNWREEFNLSEVVTGKMTDKEALKKVSEKSNINNKVTINPKLDEAVKEIGGEVVGMVEADTTAQHRRLDMKQMILDRQKLKIRRKDMAQKKKEGEGAESTNATQQSNVITAEAVQGQDTATRKAMAGERKAGDKRVAPGKAKQNAERVMQSVRFYDKITKGKHIAGVAEETEETVKQVNEKKRKNALQIQKIVGEESAVLDANTKIGNKEKRDKLKKELDTLTKRAKAMKKHGSGYHPFLHGEEVEDLKEYSPNVTYQAKGGKKSGKLGKSSVYSIRGKDESKKDFRKSYVKDIKGGYLKTEEVVSEGDVHSGQGEKIQKRTKAWMDRKGQKGAPGLDAIRARAAEHKAKRGVKEEVELDERLGGKGYQPYTNLRGEKISGDWEDSDRGKGNKAKKRAGGKVEKKSPTYRAHVLNKEEVVDEGLGASMAVTAGLNAVGNIAKAYGASQAAKGAIVGGALSGAGALGGGALNYMASRNNNKKKSDVKPQEKKKEVKEGVMKFVKSIGKKKKVEKKPSMDAITTKVHKWRKDRDEEERKKYVNDFDFGESIGESIGEAKGYQPEIEHSKLGDAKKKADKKRESKLPPHLQGDAIGKMRKAFASEDKAFEFVKNKLKAKYGDGVLTTGEKMKPPTAAQKKAAAAHQAKVDAENAAERAKDPSQGRYPKG